ncbi:MAG: glycosyltransferase [Paracoccaceae bacterium]
MVAVIPARNEEATIGRAVTALRREGIRRVLVVANACSDRTVARARASGAVVVETGPLVGGVGAARRLGCAIALGRWPEATALITTDADGRLEPGTGAAIATALEQADAVMGRICPDPAEFDALPASVRRLGALETQRDGMLAELGAICAPQAHDPPPRHLFTNGALMACRRDVYIVSGGFAEIATEEDKDFGARLARMGFRIARPWAASVTVSCRRVGRAPGGMADCIAARSQGDLGPAIEMTERQCRRIALVLRALRSGGRTALADLTTLLSRDSVPRAIATVPPTAVAPDGSSIRDTA